MPLSVFLLFLLWILLHIVFAQPLLWAFHTHTHTHTLVFWASLQFFNEELNSFCVNTACICVRPAAKTVHLFYFISYRRGLPLSEMRLAWFCLLYAFLMAERSHKLNRHFSMLGVMHSMHRLSSSVWFTAAKVCLPCPCILDRARREIFFQNR